MGNLRKRERQEDVLNKLEYELANVDKVIAAKGWPSIDAESLKRAKDRFIKIKQTDIDNLKKKLGK